MQFINTALNTAMDLKYVLFQALILGAAALNGLGCRTQNTPFPLMTSLESTPPHLSPESYLKPSRPPLQMPSGVWLANNYTSKWHLNHESITHALKQAVKLGVNAIFPVIHDKQLFYFNSQIIKAELGTSYAYVFGIDPLARTIKVAREHNLRVFPSFEGGLTIPIAQDSTGDKTSIGQLLSGRWNWLSVDRKGQVLSHCKYGICFGFLNILNPHVEHLLVRLTEEVLTGYDVDGVIFDDHFSLPSEKLGCEPTVQYDPLQRERFEQWFVDNSTSEDFTESCIEYSNILRTRAIVDFFAKIHAIAKTHGKYILISPAGTPGWSKRNWLQDWETIARKGHVDGVIMQAYRRNEKDFRAMLNSSELDFLWDPSSKVGFGAVIMLGLKSRHVHYTGQLIARQTHIAIDSGVTPSYYYHEMIDIPIEGQSKTSRLASIQAVKNQLTKHFNSTTISAAP